MRKFLLIFLVFLISCSERGIYELRFESLEGKTYSLEEFRGKKFLIYVWSGTCIGHIEDLKTINRLYPDLKDKIPIVSVAIMMDVEDIKEVLNSNGIDPRFPILADPKGELADRITLIFLPSTLLIDEKGQVVENYPKFPEKLIPSILSHN